MGDKEKTDDKEGASDLDEVSGGVVVPFGKPDHDAVIDTFREVGRRVDSVRRPDARVTVKEDPWEVAERMADLNNRPPEGRVLSFPGAGLRLVEPTEANENGDPSVRRGLLGTALALVELLKGFKK